MARTVGGFGFTCEVSFPFLHILMAVCFMIDEVYGV